MPNSFEDEELRRLETLAVRLHVPEQHVQDRLAAVRREWVEDGDAARHLAAVRTSVRLSIMVQRIAEAHAECRRETCATCPPLRDALAHALAAARHDWERRP